MENRLYRRRKGKVFGGVAAGLGQYLDIDPIIIRIVFVLVTIFHGMGLLVYIIMWIVMSEEPIENLYQTMGESFPDSTINDESNSFKFNTSSTTISTSSSNSRILVGILLIILGAIFLLERFLPTFDFELVIAIGLILLGVGLTTNFFKK